MGHDTIPRYRRAQDGFDAVLATVPPHCWDEPSACDQWTIRDVAGHIVWGQDQLRHWVTGQEHGNDAGAPGARNPGVLAGDDPLAAWRSARAAADATLTLEALDRTVHLPAVGERTVAQLLTLLVTDLLAHTWDIGHALGEDVQLAPELLPGAFAWAHDNVIRLPGFFGAELTPPADADEQTRLLAYLGRATWKPVPAARTTTD